MPRKTFPGPWINNFLNGFAHGKFQHLQTLPCFRITANEGILTSPTSLKLLQKFYQSSDLFSPEKWEERPLLGKLLATSDLRDVQIVGSIPFPAMHVQAFSNSPHISGHSCLRNQCRLLDNQGHKAADDITKQIRQPEAMEEIKISMHLFNFSILSWSFFCRKHV